jgi:hypothetical protein
MRKFHARGSQGDDGDFDETAYLVPTETVLRI